MRLCPTTVAEVQDAVRAHERLTIRGAGTKSPPVSGTEVGPGTEVGRVLLDTTGLTGIIDYSPDECVLTARAGTRLADLSAMLATHGHYLPFDPPLVDAGATIGGTTAAGLSGSGRYRYGGVRDFLIGTRVVDGEGRLIRSGGKVVKNAAGFLLHHGMVGSLGRFGVMTELTFKVFPSPAACMTLRVHCDGLAYAVDTVHAIERGRFDVAAIDFDDRGTLWIRVAGTAAALRARAERLQATVPWDTEWLEGDADAHLWAEAREFRWAPPAAALVKVPAPPLRDWTVPARFACGGSVAWAAVANDAADFSEWLAERNRIGLVVRGSMAGTLIGRVEPDGFEVRVRSVLDPQQRFSRAAGQATVTSHGT